MAVSDLFLVINIFLTLFVIIVVLVMKRPTKNGVNLQSELLVFNTELNKIGPLLREELTKGREEVQRMSRETRDELGSSVKFFTESLAQQFQALLTQQGRQSTEFSERIDVLVKINGEKF